MLSRIRSTNLLNEIKSREKLERALNVLHFLTECITSTGYSGNSSNNHNTRD